MKQKLVSLLCVVAMAASVFTGCGKTEAEEKPSESSQEASDDQKTSGNESSENESEEKELEYVELDWYVEPASGTNIPKDLDMIQAALDEYFLEKLNCKVNICMYTAADYAEVVSTKLLAGEELDICIFNKDMSYNQYASMGALYPIDTLWDEYGVNVKGLFKEGVWDSLTINDHIYSIPTVKDNATIVGYIYNDTLATELGLDMENLGWSSYMDIEETMMEALALRDEKFPEYKGKPLISQNYSDVPLCFALEKFLSTNNVAVCNIPGLEAVPEYGTDIVYNFYETDAFREMCLMTQRLVDAGVLAYDYTALEQDPKYDPATLLMTARGYTWIDEGIFGDEFSCKLVLFDDTWVDLSCYTGAMNAIGANCKDPERAMMVLDLLNSDPYVATLLRFGIEGEHWEYDENNEMQLVNRNADTANAGWLEWYGAWYGNLLIVDGPESYLGPDEVVFKTMKEYNDNAILASHMGFVLDTSAIENEISACNNVVQEYVYLTKGQVESQDAVNDAVDAFVAKLKENGSDKIVAEIQTQIDAWTAGK